MKKELDYFYIGSHYGGDQESLSDLIMRMGGCAAVTACDMCVYLTKYMGVRLVDFDANKITKADYIKLTKTMKPYLHPRFSGVNKTKMFISGFEKYLAQYDSKITFSSLEGSESIEEAKAFVKAQIDKCIPVPMLVLSHMNPSLKDFVWHWFILNGYEEVDDKLMVKVVSYGEWKWFDLEMLWDSGHSLRGGIVKVDISND